jgi:hypothetical protein
MLPCAPALTTRRLVDMMVAALGRAHRAAALPRLLVPALGVFAPVVRELGEELYQWDEPFLVDDHMFRARFPQFAPTPLEEGVHEAVAWAVERFRPRTSGVGARAAAAELPRG